MSILDCSLRDGGYTTNWYYTKEQARECYMASLKSGIDYCEIGFRRTQHTLGPWNYTPENLIHQTFTDIYSDKCKLALMAQVGTFSLTDFVPRSESLVSMVRILVAYHCYNKDDSILNIDIIKEAIQIANKLKEMGYQTSINIGRFDKISHEQVIQICKLLSNAPIEYFYIADTYGNFGIYKMRNTLALIKQNYNGKIGFHAHDNLKNASVKSIDALYNGADIVDVTFGGQGRGSGNARAEFVLSHFMNEKKYDILPAIIYADKWIEPFYSSGIVYLLSGLFSLHVNYAIEVIEKHKTLKITDIYNIFLKIVSNKEHNFYYSDIITKYRY